MKKLFNLLDKKLQTFTLFLMFLVLISMALELMSIALVIPAVAFFFDDSISRDFPTLYEFLITISPLRFFENSVSFTDYQLALFGGLLLIFLIFLIKTLFLIYFLYLQHLFTNRLRVYLSTKLLRGYINQPYSFFLLKNSSDLKRYVLSEAGNVVGTSFVLIQMVSEYFVLIAFSIFLLFNYFVPSTIVITLLVGLAIFYYFFGKEKLYEYGSNNHALEEKRFRFIQEIFGGIKTIKVFGLEKFFNKRFYESEKFQAGEILKYNLINALPRVLFEIVIIICLVTFIISFNFLGYSPQETLSALGVFLVASLRLMPSFNKLLIGHQTLKFQQKTINKVTSELINNTQNEKFNNLNESLRKKIVFERDIIVRDVSLKFLNRKEIFKNINLKIKKNEFIGISGETGSGKSSLINLIIGLIKPNEGKILIDGKDLNFSNSSWHKQIGYVSQVLHFLDDTLKNNIAYGVEENEIDHYKIEECLRLSQLDKLVSKLDRKTETMIGENALRLSGGERKRIGIARALYLKPSILILDEPTNELDKITEDKILNLLGKLKSKMTIIIISHKINSFKYCDKIFKIENKKIIEEIKS